MQNVKQQIVYKSFTTPNGFYVYDRNKNAVIGISEADYVSLENNEWDDSVSDDILKKYQAKDFLCPNRLKRIEHPATKYLPYYLENRVEQMVIQLTQNCNLRCSYCVYSGNYVNRQHTGKRMSFDIARKSIDYLLSHSKDLEEVTIGFYGGEPLLELNLIKQCVEYVNENAEGKDVLYSITTNGTLINGETVKFLMENNFTLIISLDGGKETHDVHRRFATTGKGSFELIMDNIKDIKAKYPEYIKNIFFNSVITPQSDYGCMKTFFDTDEIMNEAHVMTNTVSEFYTKDQEKYNDKYYVVSSYGYFKLLLCLVGKSEKRHVSKLFYPDIARLRKSYKALESVHDIPEVYHHGGPCIPGAKRIFVNCDGELFPCERVSEQSSVMKMGDVDTGVDVEKAKRILNVGQVTENECLSCWALLHCSMCAATADNLQTLSSTKKLQGCDHSRAQVLETMQDLCLLKEFGFHFEEEA